jgi:regulator of protease activity HflC (stomatin/prohibitin superfamily)
MGTIIAILLIILVVAAVVAFAVKSVRVVPQARVQIVERLGQYRKTLSPGLHMIVPVIDKALPIVDMRVQRKDIPPVGPAGQPGRTAGDRGDGGTAGDAAEAGPRRAGQAGQDHLG